MINKYIRGVKEHGKEVIEELEKLGGINSLNYYGDDESLIYIIRKDNKITACHKDSDMYEIINEFFEEIKLPENNKKFKVIRGSKEHGEEIIKFLESLGGKNKYNLKQTFDNCYYYIDQNGIIRGTMAKCLNFSYVEEIFLPEKKTKLKVIKGNDKRRKEIISLLESLKGDNILGCCGGNVNCYYYIDNKGKIMCKNVDDSFFNNYELEIINLPLENRFKPFDKILVRNYSSEAWFPAFFYHYNDLNKLYETTNNHCYDQCIPYEGNEKLLGTTDNYLN